MKSPPILVVDDNPANLLLMSDVLEMAGYEVVQAADAETALALIAQQPPRLILMDVGLPGMDGLTLTRRLKADPATREIRIAVVTAAAMKGDDDKAFAAGADAYITKPIDTAQLPVQVAQLLGETFANGPAPNAAEVSRREPELLATGLAPATRPILVVDDLAANRLLLREILESHGHPVMEACDGTEALAVLGCGPIEAVISDVLMPNMDGFRLCLEVRRSERFGRVPFVIYTSTYNSPADRSLAEKVGADRYLVKPAPAEEILAALHDAKERAKKRLPGTTATPDEFGVIKQYNAALVAKLEEKNAELERAVARLREQETRFRQLAETIDDVFWSATPNFRQIIYVSPAYERVWGRPIADLYAQPQAWIDAIWEEDRPRVFQALGVLGGGGNYAIEYRIRRPDGETRWVLDRGFLVRDTAGTIYRTVGVAADITARKELEAKAAARERRLNAFFSGATAGLAMLDRNLRFVQINETLAHINGHPAAAHTGRLFEEMVPAMAPLIVPVLERVRDSGEPVLNFESAGETPSHPGKRRSWTASYFPVFGESGQVDGVGAIVVEVTERKEAEEELRASEARFRQLAESVHEVFWLSDPEKNAILYVSPAYAKIWGRSCASLLAAPRTWLDALHPDDAPRIGAAARTKQAAGTYDEEYRVLRPDGTMAWIRDRAFPIRDASGRVYRIAGVATDITEQKEARERIDEQARLLDLTQDSITVRDLNDDIRYWNRGSEILYGWSSDEVAGRRATEVLRPKPELFSKAKSATLAHGEWNGELQQVHRSGRTVIVDSRWTLMRDERDQPKAILVVSSDISEKKQLAAQFFRAQRLESIGTLASGIAHDLNNILAPILMAAPMLRWGLPPKEVEKMLVTIESSAQRGANLVRQLLTFGRGVEGERGVLSPQTLLNEMVKITQQTFPKSINVVSTIEPDLWPILGDATQLHQVLLNLCVNARDAMPAGGTLSVTAGNERLDENYAGMADGAKPGDYVVLRVADTGTGIPPEIVDKIFDPFFTTKEIGKGTGLGLATVLGIVKSHGGFVTLQTHVGSGTTFLVHLPAAQAAIVPETGSTSPAALSRGHGELLLVVDDEANIRDIIRGTLVRRDYKVITASDGAEGLAKYAEMSKQIAAVITDLDMPVMDGLAMIQVMKRMNPAVRVLVSSGVASNARMKHRQAELRAFGVGEILAKPYSADRLLAAVHELLSQTSDRLTPRR